VVVIVGFEQVVIYFYVGSPFSYIFNLHEVLAEFYVYRSAEFLIFSDPSPPWCKASCGIAATPEPVQALDGR